MSWKQVERAIAKRLGGKRVGCTGQATPDVVTDWLSIEVKSRKALPKWLWEGIEQARRGCREDQLAILVLHEKGEHHDNDLVILRLADFEGWFGDVGAATVGRQN